MLLFRPTSRPEAPSRREPVESELLPAAGPHRRGRLSRRRRWGPVSRRGRWRRTIVLRVLSATLLGVAVWVAVSALLPVPADPGVPCLVVTRDLPVGTALTTADLRLERRASEQLPAGVLRSADAAVGRVLSGPVLAGEILSTARFQGPDQLVGLRPGSLAVGVPLSDPALAAALRPGDVVSILVGGSGQVVAPSAVVLAVRPEDHAGLVGSGASARLLVAVTVDEAHGLAAATGPAGSAATLLVALRR